MRIGSGTFNKSLDRLIFTEEAGGEYSSMQRERGNPTADVHHPWD